MATWQFVDTDLTTVLADLNDPTGANNSSFGSAATRFGLGSSWKIDVPHNAERWERPALDGGFTTFSRRGLATVSWRQFISASSEANLRLFLGRLTDLITRGGILKIVTGATRYLRFEPSLYPTPYQGKELELYAAHALFALNDGLDITLTAQPWLEGAETTVAGVTVPNDPATSTKVRVFPATIAGDLPTPAKIRVQVDAGSAVRRLLVAHRSRLTRAASYFADYLSDTGFAQLEATGRGWTVALGTDTAGAIDGQASPGAGTSAVQAAPTVAVPQRRVALTRTTKLDSLRGAWDVWIRARNPNTDSANWIQLRWGLTTADPAPFSNQPVQLDTRTASVFVYTEKNLGTIYLPEDVSVPISGLRLEIWHWVGDGTDATTNFDEVWLVPHDTSSTLVVQRGPVEYAYPGGNLTRESGSTAPWLNITTPVTNPAAGTAGTFHIATTDDPPFLELDTTTDNAGPGPNAGVVFPAGRHRFGFLVSNPGGATRTVKLVVRNITGSADLVALTASYAAGEKRWEYLEADLNGTSAYQPQVDDPSAASMNVYQFSHQFVGALASGESARSDPGARYAVDRLDSSGNITSYLAVEGAIPGMLDPGDNHIMVRCDDVPPSGYGEQHESKLARTPTVSVVYTPRYSL